MRALEVISTIEWIDEQSKDFRIVLAELMDKVQRNPEGDSPMAEQLALAVAQKQIHIWGEMV